jgi:choloylglycine hydrolase
MKNFSLLALAISLWLAPTSLLACTGLELIQEDKTVVHGRTLEFGVPVVVNAAVVPRNYDFSGTTPLGKGLAYKSKYGVVGMYAFKNIAILDGMNEKGLAAGTFYFPGFAGYTTITPENQAKGLSATEFVNWILTQFATLDEIKEAIKNVVIAPTVVEGWGPVAPPMHYIVYDPTGHNLIIEPIDGKLVVTEDTLGTFTNSPNIEWHHTNLRNYINLRADNIPPRKFDGMELAAFGQGSGMVGLPGDFTPPSRFVRAAIFSQASLPVKTSQEGIFQLFHILNQFDIPVGIARDVENGVIYSDSTQMTCARDPSTLKFYFRTFADQTIRMVDLKQFDLNSKSLYQASTVATEPFVDVSKTLK